MDALQEVADVAHTHLSVLLTPPRLLPQATQLREEREREREREKEREREIRITE